MDRFLLDTDILIDLSHEIPKAVGFVEEIKEECSISIISLMELIRGARNQKEIDGVLEIEFSFNVENITEEVSSKALEILSSKFLSTGLEIPDALIAALAIENNLVLVTRNVRHFEQIEGLKIKILPGY